MNVMPSARVTVTEAKLADANEFAQLDEFRLRSSEDLVCEQPISEPMNAAAGDAIRRSICFSAEQQSGTVSNCRQWRKEDRNSGSREGSGRERWRWPKGVAFPSAEQVTRRPAGAFTPPQLWRIGPTTRPDSRSFEGFWFLDNFSLCSLRTKLSL